METEFSLIPNTLSGKSPQMKNRKEELEYQLSIVDKYLGRNTRSATP